MPDRSPVPPLGAIRVKYLGPYCWSTQSFLAPRTTWRRPRVTSVKPFSRNYENGSEEATRTEAEWRHRSRVFHVPTLLTLTKLTQPHFEAVRGGLRRFCQQGELAARVRNRPTTARPANVSAAAAVADESQVNRSTGTTTNAEQSFALTACAHKHHNAFAKRTSSTAPQFPDRIFRAIDGLLAVKASSAQLLSFPPARMPRNRTPNTLSNPSWLCVQDSDIRPLTRGESQSGGNSIGARRIAR